MINHCHECICQYCRWRCSDNCLKDKENPCGKCHKGNHEFWECEGFEMRPTKKGASTTNND